MIVFKKIYGERLFPN